MWLCKRDLSKECKGDYKDCTDCILDKIRAEIEFEVDHRTNMLCAEDVLEIIDKYRGEIEPKTGHWIDHHLPEVGKCMQYMSECSVCGKMICNRYNIYKNFCPCCGAKMEEEQKTT